VYTLKTAVSLDKNDALKSAKIIEIEQSTKEYRGSNDKKNDKQDDRLDNIEAILNNNDRYWSQKKNHPEKEE